MECKYAGKKVVCACEFKELKHAGLEFIYCTCNACKFPHWSHDIEDVVMVMWETIYPGKGGYMVSATTKAERQTIVEIIEALL